MSPPGDFRCSICLEKLWEPTEELQETPVSVLTCGHTFHTHCIQTYFRGTRKQQEDLNAEEPDEDPSEITYRCGFCNQESHPFPLIVPTGLCSCGKCFNSLNPEERFIRQLYFSSSDEEGDGATYFNNEMYKALSDEAKGLLHLAHVVKLVHARIVETKEEFVGMRDEVEEMEVKTLNGEVGKLRSWREDLKRIMGQLEDALISERVTTRCQTLRTEIQELLDVSSGGNHELLDTLDSLSTRVATSESAADDHHAMYLNVFQLREQDRTAHEEAIENFEEDRKGWVLKEQRFEHEKVVLALDAVSKDGQIQMLKENVQGLQAERNQLRDDVTRMVKQELDITIAKRERDSYKRKVADLMKRLEPLDQIRASNAELRQSLASTQSAKDRAELKALDMENQYSRANIESFELKLELETLSAHYQELQEDNETLEIENDHLQTLRTQDWAYFKQETASRPSGIGKILGGTGIGKSRNAGYPYHKRSSSIAVVLATMKEHTSSLRQGRERSMTVSFSSNAVGSLAMRKRDARGEKQTLIKWEDDYRKNLKRHDASYLPATAVPPVAVASVEQAMTAGTKLSEETKEKASSQAQQQQSKSNGTKNPKKRKAWFSLSSIKNENKSGSATFDDEDCVFINSEDISPKRPRTTKNASTHTGARTTSNEIGAQPISPIKLNISKSAAINSNNNKRRSISGPSFFSVKTYRKKNKQVRLSPAKQEAGKQIPIVELEELGGMFSREGNERGVPASLMRLRTREGNSIAAGDGAATKREPAETASNPSDTPVLSFGEGGNAVGSMAYFGIVANTPGWQSWNPSWNDNIANLGRLASSPSGGSIGSDSADEKSWANEESRWSTGSPNHHLPTRGSFGSDGTDHAYRFPLTAPSFNFQPGVSSNNIGHSSLRNPFAAGYTPKEDGAGEALHLAELQQRGRQVRNGEVSVEEILG